MTAGKRIFTLKRMLNAKLGSTQEDDRLPDFMLTSLKDGGSLGFTPELEPLLTGAYKEHGWDTDTGMPNQETLEEFGLEFTIN